MSLYRPSCCYFFLLRAGFVTTATKHTLENIQEVPEVVINICDFEMVQQVSLSSCEYAKEVDEFNKAGFIKEPASGGKAANGKGSEDKTGMCCARNKTAWEQGRIRYAGDC